MSSSSSASRRTALVPWIGVILISLGGLGLLAAVIAIVHDHTAALISVIIGGVLTLAGMATMTWAGRKHDFPIKT